MKQQTTFRSFFTINGTSSMTVGRTGTPANFIELQIHRNMGPGTPVPYRTLIATLSPPASRYGSTPVVNGERHYRVISVEELGTVCCDRENCRTTS